MSDLCHPAQLPQPMQLRNIAQVNPFQCQYWHFYILDNFKVKIELNESCCRHLQFSTQDSVTLWKLGFKTYEKTKTFEEIARRLYVIVK